ncbi:hypothetical protein SAMN04487905_112192 [Actinopolyspora xinjiangensis]|uniref:Uncharacterized protein n=1 Tax=Actinopolyspora xinjiangensis TaxID=405564 RepID=A0A1H0WJK6_9ACTN|nr:hypothetical protein SAMN04487905_112192 [Actinopolyspora xinjiangensis]
MHAVGVRLALERGHVRQRRRGFLDLHRGRQFVELHVDSCVMLIQLLDQLGLVRLQLLDVLGDRGVRVELLDNFVETSSVIPAFAFVSSSRPNASSTSLRSSRRSGRSPPKIRWSSVFMVCFAVSTAFVNSLRLRASASAIACWASHAAFDRFGCVVCSPLRGLGRLSGGPGGAVADVLEHVLESVRLAGPVQSRSMHAHRDAGPRRRRPSDPRWSVLRDPPPRGRAHQASNAGPLAPYHDRASSDAQSTLRHVVREPCRALSVVSHRCAPVLVAAAIRQLRTGARLTIERLRIRNTDKGAYRCWS